MIRVILAGKGESFSDARTRRPELAGPDPASLLRQLAGASFDGETAAAVRSALRELGGAHADVVVAPGASLYRIFAGPPPAPPEITEAGLESDRGRWAAQEQGAVVLVAGHSGGLARLVHGLQFVGYEAHLAKGTDARALAAALAQHGPLATILESQHGDGLDPESLAACRALGSAVILLGGARSEGIDAVLPTPIVTAELAAIVDPLVRAARERRASA